MVFFLAAGRLALITLLTPRASATDFSAALSRAVRPKGLGFAEAFLVVLPAALVVLPAVLAARVDVLPPLFVLAAFFSMRAAACYSVTVSGSVPLGRFTMVVPCLM